MASIVSTVRFPCGVMLTAVKATISCATSVRLTFTSTVVASILMGIAASWPGAVVITTLALICCQMVKSTGVKILPLVEAHELTNFIHQESFDLVSCHQEYIAMRTTKRMIEPFFGSFVGWIWLDSSRQLLCIFKAFLPMAVVVQTRRHSLLGYSGFHETEHDTSRLWTIEIALHDFS